MTFIFGMFFFLIFTLLRCDHVFGAASSCSSSSTRGRQQDSTASKRNPNDHEVRVFLSSESDSNRGKNDASGRRTIFTLSDNRDLSSTPKSSGSRGSMFSKGRTCNHQPNATSRGRAFLRVFEVDGDDEDHDDHERAGSVTSERRVREKKMNREMSTASEAGQHAGAKVDKKRETIGIIPAGPTRDHVGSIIPGGPTRDHGSIINSAWRLDVQGSDSSCTKDDDNKRSSGHDDKWKNNKHYVTISAWSKR